MNTITVAPDESLRQKQTAVIFKLFSVSIKIDQIGFWSMNALMVFFPFHGAVHPSLNNFFFSFLLFLLLF